MVVGCTDAAAALRARRDLRWVRCGSPRPIAGIAAVSRAELARARSCARFRRRFRRLPMPDDLDRLDWVDRCARRRPAAAGRPARALRLRRRASTRPCATVPPGETVDVRRGRRDRSAHRARRAPSAARCRAARSSRPCRAIASCAPRTAGPAGAAIGSRLKRRLLERRSAHVGATRRCVIGGDRLRGAAERAYFLTLSASAASSAVGISPPAFWARLMSDSLLPTKTSSIRP